jgi:excinuclease ABC subunit C
MNEPLQHLKDLVKSFPSLPGVYIMKNDSGEVLYVGKARDLKARVKTYMITGGDGRIQIEYLMRKVRNIENVVCASEDQAFILERDLISKYKPRYNIRLKDDKAYLNVRIDLQAKFPRVELVRKVQNDGASYFGPYTYSHELKSLIEVIKRVVPLRTCSDPVFYNRQRPCLEYQINRCCGPCTIPINREEYMQLVKQAVSILKGNSSTIVKDLEQQMEAASEELRFEHAAALRDRIDVLQRFSKGEKVSHSNGEHSDIFSLFREEGLAAITVLKFRYGRIAETENFSINDVSVTDDEVLQNAIMQFYEAGREIPDEIILGMELQEKDFLKKFLSSLPQKTGSFQITVPERGSKFRMLQLADVNAKQYFATRFNAEDRYNELARKLAKIAGLRQMPRKIECADISNFQGSDIVGAVVTFFDGIPMKSAYRKYIISAQGKPDDFASMYEIVSRRIRSGAEEDSLPDVLIIDGGAGQLNAALKARDDQGIELEIISLAKIRTVQNDKKNRPLPIEVDSVLKEEDLLYKNERIFLPNKEEPVILKPDDPLCHLMQRIRDEVHRFVISFHRQRRSGRIFTSSLDGIKGVGKERKKKLLDFFGTVENIRYASVEEIARVAGCAMQVAERVKSIA